MLRRDLIMVLAEELGKAVTQLQKYRDSDDLDGGFPLIQKAYDSLHTNKAFLMEHSMDEIRSTFDEIDMEGLSRMELAAKVLYEESFHDPEEQDGMRQKVKEMLEYIQNNDSVYSIERIQLIGEIEALLS